MSFELLQSHLQSTLETIGNTHGRNSKKFHQKTNSGKEKAVNQQVHHSSSSNSKLTKPKVGKKKRSNIEKAATEFREREKRAQQVIQQLESESSTRKHSVSQIMKIVKLYKKQR